MHYTIQSVDVTIDIYNIKKIKAKVIQNFKIWLEIESLPRYWNEANRVATREFL